MEDELNISRETVQIPVTPTKVEEERRGDDLMAEADGIDKVADEDVELARRFDEGNRRIEAKMMTDEKYAKSINQKLEGLQKKGDFKAFFDAVVDENDALLEEHYRKTKPEWFTGRDAAIKGFLNEATFNQLSRIKGLIAEDGVDPREAVRAEAEKIRVLERAFPGYSFAGHAMAYVTPGSPVAALMKGALKVGSYAAAKAASKGVFSTASNVISTALFDKVKKNPLYLQKLAQNVIGVAGGSGVQGMIKGGLGEDFQDPSLDRALSMGEEQAEAAAFLTAVLPPAARIALRGAGALSSGAAKVVARASQKPAATLKEFALNNKRIQESVKGINNTKEELLDFLYSKRAGIKEITQADRLLPYLPDVNAERMLSVLESVKKKAAPELAPVVDNIHTFARNLRQKIADNGADPKKVPAKLMRELIEELDVAFDSGEIPGFYDTVLRNARRAGRSEMMVTALKGGGQTGKTYYDLMRKGAQKTDILVDVRRMMGRDRFTAENRINSFLNTFLGQNSEIRMQRLETLDRRFGFGYAQRFKDYATARQMGPEGKATLLPEKGNIFAATAKAAGGDSPFIAQHMYGAATNMSTFFNEMAANPNILRAMAGKMGAAAGRVRDKAGNYVNNVSKSAGIDMSGIRIPPEVRKISQRLLDTLEKDGPLSLESSLKLAARTPYFIGVAHYFDVLQRRQGKSQSQDRIVERVRQKVSDVATTQE